MLKDLPLRRPLDELQAEYRSIQLQYRVAAAAAFSTLLIGTLFFHYVEHFSWIDAVYFCTITLTTIGYGDIVPTTPAAKLFTVFYVLIGIGIIAFFVNIVIKNAVMRREVRKSKRRQQ